jgi:NYN domain-containing protein
VLVDRCALFVDASYMLADGAMAVHGTRRRDSVSWDYAGLLKLLSGLCSDGTGLPLLRCYWYEATVEGRRTSEHDALADLAHLKLRLGRLRPGRREGVESEMHRDLIALAKNGAITEAVVVSGDEDLTEVISEVQELGVRVLIGCITVDGSWTISRPLRQECDEVLEISGAHLRPFVDLIPGAEPRRDDDYAPGYPVASSNGHGPGLGAVTHHGLPAAALPAPPLYNAPVLPGYQRPGPAGGQSGSGGQDNHAGAGQGGALPGGALPGGAIPGGGSHAAPSGLPGQANGLPRRAAERSGSLADGPLGGQGPLGNSRQQNVPQRDPLSGPLPGSGATGGQQSGRHGGDQAAPLSPNASFPPLDQFHDRLPADGSGPGAGQAGGARHSGGQAGGSSAATQQYQQPGAGYGSADPLSIPSFGGQAGQQAQGGQVTQGGQPGQGAGQTGPQPAQHGAAGQMSHSGPIGPAAGMGQSGLSQPGAMGQGGSISQSGQMGQSPAMGQGAAMGQSGLPSQGMAPPPMGQGQPAGQAQGQPAAMGGGSGSLGPAGGAAQQGGGLNQPGGFGQGQGQPSGAGLGPSSNGLSQGSGLGPSFGPGPNQFTNPQPGGTGPVPQPVAVSLADAVQAAHAEGFGFGEAVARDAPALWLEAVLARKPRMPSDLEARLLQGSALPIDSLLHDEVRHALRRGFWDALERSRR